MSANIDEIAKNLTDIKKNLAPELEKLLNGYEAKTVVIFLTAIVKSTLKDIDEEDFTELIFKYFIGDYDEI